MGGFNIQMKGINELVSALKAMSGRITPAMYETLQEAADEAKSIMQEGINSRTGSLRDSIDYDIRDEGNKISAYVGPNDSSFSGRPVGRATELGRSPGGGFPNWYDIANRYGVSLGVGYLIAKSIYEKGSSGLFYGQKAEDIVKGTFLERGISAIRTITSTF
jgi:hypothetical protein